MTALKSNKKPASKKPVPTSGKSKPAPTSKAANKPAIRKSTAAAASVPVQLPKVLSKKELLWSNAE